MIKSMTGFGGDTVNTERGQLSIAIRVVNSRYFDLKVRGINLGPELDLETSSMLREFLKRGNIQLIIESNSSDNSEKLLKLNKRRYEAIESMLQAIQMEYGRHIELSDIITFKDLFVEIDKHDPQKDQFIPCLIKALKQVDAMRKTEGKKIHKIAEDAPPETRRCCCSK